MAHRCRRLTDGPRISPLPGFISLAPYLQALFSANPGHFRVIAFVVTSKPVIENPEAQVTREEALDGSRRGVTNCPESMARLFSMRITIARP